MPNTDRRRRPWVATSWCEAAASSRGSARCRRRTAITLGRAGAVLAQFELVDAGVRCCSRRRHSLQDPLPMRREMDYSLGLDVGSPSTPRSPG